MTAFDEDRLVWTIGAAIATVSGTADATYSANEVTLINDITTAVNAILVVLRDANFIALD